MKQDDPGPAAAVPLERDASPVQMPYVTPNSELGVEEKDLAVSVWLTAFPQEMELKFKTSLMYNRRSICLVASVLIGITDTVSGVANTIILGPLSWEEEWPMPTLFWLLNGILHLLFAVATIEKIWRQVHLYAPDLLAFWIVVRFAAYSVFNVLFVVETHGQQIDTTVAVVAALLCTPMMLALAVVNPLLLLFSQLTLMGTSILYFTHEPGGVTLVYRLGYLSGAALCIAAMSYITVLHQRTAFLNEERIKEVSTRELSALELQTRERAAAKLAQNRAEAYGNVVAATVHDLRSPLAAWAVGCRVLQHSFKTCATAQDALDQCNEVLRHMDTARGMNQQLLDSMSFSASLLRDEVIKPQSELVNVRELLTSAMSLVTLSRPVEGDVVFKMTVDDAIGHILTDNLAVSRNILNLLGNAVRHTQHGLIECSATLLIDDEQKRIKFSVSDTGPGGCTGLPKIWEPFISHAGSTGLGLYVVKKQTELLGGRVGIAENLSSGCGGSIFWFSLPYIHHPAPEVNAANQSESVEVVSKASAMAGNSQSAILLIDDIQYVLEAQALVLRAEGFTVYTALGAARGMELLKQRVYTLVLCDYNMPGKTGAELTAEFRHWEAEQSAINDNVCEKLQVIFALTGHSRQEVETECLTAGMHGVIAKPIDCDCVRRLSRSHSLS